MLSNISGTVPCYPRRVARGFPVRPQPFPAEAAIGYVIRVAQANGFGTPRQLWHALRQSDTCPATFESLSKMVGLASDDCRLLQGPLPHYWRWAPTLGAGLTVNDYNHSLLRWCPRCLDESPHLRGVWGLKLQCVCTRHFGMLVDRCPACGARQRFERSDITRCSCGARLAAVEVADVPPLLCELCERLVCGCVTEERQLSPLLSAGEWHRLVRYLGQFSLDFEPARPGQLVGLHRLDAATTVVTGAAWLLENWPEHFNQLLQRIQDRRREMQSLRRSFGCLYRVLYVDLQTPGFQFLRDAFEKYLGENWWGLVCKRNRSLRNETVTTHPRLTLAAAAEQAGTSLSTVRHLIEAKLISVEEGVMPSGRRVRSVHSFDVPRISSLTHEALTLTEVASLLALPEKRVRMLVATGLLTPLLSKKETRAATWMFPASQVEEYCSIAGSGRSDGVPVSLKQILKSWRLHDGEFSAVVNAIRERKLLPLSDRPTPLGRVALDAKAARTWLRERRQTFEESISIDQAARALRVKQEVAYGLVKRGFLHTTPALAGQRRIRKIDLYAFMETFVSLAALARSRGHSPRATLRMLQACPVCGPTVDGARQYFFRRSDFRADELPPVGNLRGDQVDQASKIMKGVPPGA